VDILGATAEGYARKAAAAVVAFGGTPFSAERYLSLVFTCLLSTY
jgi:hypothetical protein